MEYNSLDFYIKLKLKDKDHYPAGTFIYSLLSTLTKLDMNIPYSPRWAPNLGQIYRKNYSHTFVNTKKFFKVKRFNYEVRYIFYTLEIEKEYFDPNLKWFMFSILFRTEDLAKDPENDSVCFQQFEYSDLCKKEIFRLASDLHRQFRKAYVIFSNEFNDCEFITSIERLEFGDPDETISDFELAIVPKDHIGNKFITKGQTKGFKNFRILKNNLFLR